VAETAAGNLLYAWSRYRSANVGVYEIEYTLLDYSGQPLRAITRLTDHSAAVSNTYDLDPVVAAAPNGYIGILWYRYLADDSGGVYRYLYNVYFAVLDASGNVVVPETNLTNNTEWYQYDPPTYNVPRFFQPRIAATADNRFILAWQRQHEDSTGSFRNVWYAVRDTSGNLVRDLTQLTTAGSDTFHSANAAPNNRAILTWARDWDIYYAVLDSGGNVVWSETNLTNNGQGRWDSDAAALSDGRILIAWSNYDYVQPKDHVAIAVLDGSTYGVISGPTSLPYASPTGDRYISAAADTAGHAILTWMDSDWSNRGHLYYALVDSGGNVLTPPMFFRTGQGVAPQIETSYSGYGNTSFHWTPPAGVDAYVTATTPLSGTIGGYARVPVRYGNRGGTTASNVVLEALLAPGLTYAEDSSGVTPVVVGNSVQWTLSPIAFMEGGSFSLYLDVPATTTAGAHLPVTLTLTSDGPEIDPADNTAVAEVVAGPPPGGPDDFGYTWDDNEPFHWKEANGGTELDMSDCVASPLALPFPFKFYENIYNEVWVGRYGLIGFDSDLCSSGDNVPAPGVPNNLIAAYWTYLTLDANSHVYYATGGTAPNRYAVVQWDQVHDGYAENTFTFQAVLWENGDIQVQYQTMTYGAGYFYCETVGIEDAAGLDGLAYTTSCEEIPNETAVRFFRPAPAARVQLRPPYQGQFARPGAPVDFQQPVRNTGELGSDTYDLASASSWPLAFYAADGSTPLTDTDSDGTVDTGALVQGQQITIVVRLTVPMGAVVGDYNASLVTATSSLDAARNKPVTLQAAVPAPFAQVYDENADGAMSLYLVQPHGQALRKATADEYYGYNPAVVETPAGDLFYAWRKGRCLGDCSVYVYEIEYTLFDARGELLWPPARLADLGGATISTYDILPAVAVAPNGRIGILWYRYLYDYSSGSSRYLYNVYMAILDAAGNVVLPATNVTNNSEWYQSNPPTYNVPRFYTPHLAVTGDNRFVVAWRRDHGDEAGYVDDIYYAVRDSAGNEVFPITRFTADTPGYDESYYNPNVARLGNNRVLLTYDRSSDGDIYYAVLDSSGGVVQPATNLVGDGTANYDWLSDAVALSDGRIVVAWEGGNYPAYTIRFAVLDAAYNRVAGPTTLDNKPAFLGNYGISLAADTAGHAILTWMDYDRSYCLHLYYALVDGAGSVVTPPMIFRTAADRGTYSYIETSYSGFGNTSYSWTPPGGVDGFTTFDVSLAAAAPGKGTGLPLHNANLGATPAVSVVLTATLGAGLSYDGDTSGYTPTVSGAQVVWALPDMVLLERHDFVLSVTVASSATIGSRLPVTLTLVSAGPEANPGDNQATVQVMVALQCYLPLILRNR
jgi:hypothetical protein